MLKPSILFSLSRQLVDPAGFWAHAHHPAFCKSLDGAYSGCGPSDENGTAPAVAAPVVPGPGVRIPSISTSDRPQASGQESILTIESLSPLRVSSVLPSKRQSGVSGARPAAVSRARAVCNGPSFKSSLGDGNGSQLALNLT